MILGQEIFYINFKKKEVCKGVIKQVHATSSGYEAYLIKKEDGSLTQSESSICFESEEQAKNNLDHLCSINDEMNKIAEESKSRIDALRIEILGEPNCKDL